MTTISEAYENVKRLQLRKQVPIILEQNKEYIADLNRYEQLYKRSIDSESTPLRLYSSAGYSFEKEKKNPSPGYGRPDLFLTGAFYKGFKVTIQPQFYLITSTDSKTKKLIAKYGENIFGLSQFSKDQLVEEKLRKGLANHIFAVTGLG